MAVYFDDHQVVFTQCSLDGKRRWTRRAVHYLDARAVPIRNHDALKAMLGRLGVEQSCILCECYRFLSVNTPATHGTARRNSPSADRDA